MNKIKKSEKPAPSTLADEEDQEKIAADSKEEASETSSIAVRGVTNADAAADDEDDEFRKHFWASMSKERAEELEAPREYRQGTVPALGVVHYSSHLPPQKTSLQQYQARAFPTQRPCNRID